MISRMRDDMNDDGRNSLFSDDRTVRWGQSISGAWDSCISYMHTHILVLGFRVHGAQSRSFTFLLCTAWTHRTHSAGIAYTHNSTQCFFCHGDNFIMSWEQWGPTLSKGIFALISRFDFDYPFSIPSLYICANDSPLARQTATLWRT